MVVLVPVLEYELDELVLVLASPLPGDLHMWSTVMVLGFVCYLYGLYFFPGHDTQAHLLYDSPLALPCCCLVSNNPHRLKLEPLWLLSFGMPWSYLVLSRNLDKHKCAVTVFTVQTEFL